MLFIFWFGALQRSLPVSCEVSLLCHFFFSSLFLFFLLLDSVSLVLFVLLISL